MFPRGLRARSTRAAPGAWRPSGPPHSATRRGRRGYFACRARSQQVATLPGGARSRVTALGLARAFFGAVASGAPCVYWGEDGTWRILERERIDPEYRSPLYTPALAELWQGAR